MGVRGSEQGAGHGPQVSVTGPPHFVCSTSFFSALTCSLGSAPALLPPALAGGPEVNKEAVTGTWGLEQRGPGAELGAPRTGRAADLWVWPQV